MQLLEREAQLMVVGAALGDVASGTGRALLFEAAAGLGKTVLLDEIARRCTASGLPVDRVAGDDLLSTVSYGVLTRLLSSAVGRLDARTRRALRAGPARLAVDLIQGFDGRAVEAVEGS